MAERIVEADVLVDRITEERVPASVEVYPAYEIPLLDDAVPLVRDEVWEWSAVFIDASGQPTDLVGKTVTAELRWAVGEQAVVVESVDTAAGQVLLTLDAEDTSAMPYGQLLKLYLAIDGDTEAVIDVNVVEGYSS